ncbi:hypothetical protein NUU61_008039 [Penicillium alfredii]|uniref:Uncharacterized protein n=1 Tax=Penicillium alfredii TaxID=1506179 RepID=A0A9W9JZK5_9EURO|nr:uncharacterized protein NUU61_008039 [Penicillium alfredii]KAJ5086732.1 hypothetical protein NUU61_008039 [Penicillium alfredii]
MSSAHFRLEPFRPWIPSQDKAHLGRKRLDLCRYPSPVSISATSSSPHQKSPVSQNQNINAPGPEQHPLPARPPTEVCLNSSPKLDSQSTRSEREVFALPSSADPEPGISSGFPDSVFSDCVPNFLDVDLPMPFDDIVHDPGHQFSRFSSSDLELASTMDQHSQPIPTGDSCDATIDPTILYDHHPRDAGQTPAREVIPGNATSTGGSPVEYTHSPHEDTHFDRVQENPPNGLKPGWRPSKINKVSVVVDNRAKKRGWSVHSTGRRPQVLPFTSCSILCPFSRGPSPVPVLAIRGCPVS